MISNITNALPVLLKRIRDNEDRKELKFNLSESLNFYDSILPRSKTSYGLKHIYLDCIFRLRDKYRSLISSFQFTIDTQPFIKDFEYITDEDNNLVVIRGNCEEFSIFALTILAAIKNLPQDKKNKGIFISLAFHYLKYCYDSGYKPCSIDDIRLLEKYNEGFDEEVFDSIGFAATDERAVGTIHFVGIDLNKDILKIFENYKDIQFTYNEENASFIISMRARDWDDFWKDAPKYLKDEFGPEEASKVDIM